MDLEQAGSALRRAEAALEQGEGLKGTGFWKVVDAARTDRLLAEQLAGRIATIDTAAFEAGVKVRVPAAAGTAALAGGTLAGAAALVAAFTFDGQLIRTALFLGGLGALEVSTHSLAHWAVGRAMGMRFTHYFLGGPPPPRPGAKVDYSTYLLVPPRRRAVMHASGAVVTKLIPFTMLPVASKLDLPNWVTYLLLVVGAGQIVTDVLFSTKTSDWKKVRRELRAARSWSAA
ncbi:MAG: hypothetical protein ACT4OM_12960 [Actinomycetota bacterium]